MPVQALWLGSVSDAIGWYIGGVCVWIVEQSLVETLYTASTQARLTRCMAHAIYLYHPMYI